MTTLFGINIAYIIASFLFILGLKKLSSPATARKGNLISAIGMGIAVIATLFDQAILSFTMIAVGLVIGTLLGIIINKRAQMTQMPQLVALLNGLGGLSSLFVGWAAYIVEPSMSVVVSVTVILSVFIGGITFTGSMIAWAKLKEIMTTKPIMFPGQNIFNIALLVGLIGLSVMFSLDPLANAIPFFIIIGISLILGIMAIISIGGGDMPVVISLLNSYSGLAACAAGFAVNNNLLIVAGALVGASGIILTNIMCKAMNRSLYNVLFSGFGSGVMKAKATTGESKPISPEDAYLILEAANSVVIVPGYGLAVAQAQHAVRELSEQLEAKGAEVRFAIHPVAGRMPGHMNVLLAEANIPYDQLSEMDDVNPTLENVDVCIIIGANDVVNPDAKEDKGSPIYGMPIIEAYKAKTVFVLKRSMNPGFAGIENPLFFKDNTRMIFGDAKQTVQALVAAFKSA